MAIYSGFNHWKWWFSIAMLVYQRVYHSRSQIIISWYTMIHSCHYRSSLSLSVFCGWNPPFPGQKTPHLAAALQLGLQLELASAGHIDLPPCQVKKSAIETLRCPEMWHQRCKNPGYRRLLGEQPKVWIVSELRLWQNIARIPTLSQFERGKACWSHRLFSVLSREAV